MASALAIMLVRGLFRSMVNSTPLSRRIAACIYLAGQGVPVDQVKRLDPTKSAIEAGWPIPAEGMLREKVDRFELYDATRESWIALQRPKRKPTYSAKDLADWILALNRMFGYALPRPHRPAGRPKGDRLKQQIAFVSEAKQLASESNVSLNTAMKRLAMKHGFTESDFDAARRALSRKNSQ